MKITLTTAEKEEYFYNAMCNGLDYVLGCYDLSMTYNTDEYKATKATLDAPCYEDVLMQMLRMGYTLTIDDCDNGDTHSITMKEVHERVENAPIHHLMDMHNENDDADTADAILQSVFFNDIIFA
jgi:hypothetical protein